MRFDVKRENEKWTGTKRATRKPVVT